MVKRLRKRVKKIFREFLLYHHSSLEYRAKILTLVVAVNEKITPCEEELLKKIASEIYQKDEERAEILVETIKEYFNKIITNNGLDFEHLIYKVEKETKEMRRFAHKIDAECLMQFQACIDDEEDKIYQRRVIDFLVDLKKRYV